MGEANPEAWALLTKFLGEPPRYEHRDNLVILHLGQQSLTAPWGVLYSNPSVFGHSDPILVSWAGRHIEMEKRAPECRSSPGEAAKERSDG